MRTFRVVHQNCVCVGDLVFCWKQISLQKQQQQKQNKKIQIIISDDACVIQFILLVN